MAQFEIFVQWAIVTAFLSVAVWYAAIVPIITLLSQWGVISTRDLDRWQGNIRVACVIVLGIMAAMEITYPAHRQAAVLTQSGELIRLPHGGIDRLLPEGKVVTIQNEIPCALWQFQAHLPGIEAYMEIQSPVSVELAVADADLLYRVERDDAVSGFRELCRRVRDVMVTEMMTGSHGAYGWSYGEQFQTPKEKIPEYRDDLARRIQARFEKYFGGIGLQFTVTPQE